MAGLVLSSIIKYIMASASKNKLAALFYGCKEAIPLRIPPDEMGHAQPGPMPITTDNSTAVGLILDSMMPKSPNQWKYDSNGWSVNEPRHNSNFYGLAGTKTMQIILANTTHPKIIKLYNSSMSV